MIHANEANTIAAINSFLISPKIIIGTFPFIASYPPLVNYRTDEMYSMRLFSYYHLTTINLVYHCISECGSGEQHQYWSSRISRSPLSTQLSPLPPTSSLSTSPTFPSSFPSPSLLFSPSPHPLDLLIHDREDNRWRGWWCMIGRRKW